MKKILSLIAFVIVLTIMGCSTISEGKNKSVEAKNRARIENVEKAQNANTQNKIDQISELAYGTGYALNKMTNPPVEATVAKDLNERIISISGNPTVEKMKEMQEMIDKLTSELELEREQGKKLLSEKDKEIGAIQSQSKLLSDQKDLEIARYMQQAAAVAAKTDSLSVQLDEYKGWFGLKAVWMGLKQFIKSSMWAIGIGSILFLILRIASLSNPVAASAFSIFNMMGSWIVNGIKILLPKSVEVAGHVTQKTFNAYKSTLVKIVDGVQLIRDRSKTTGTIPSIEDALDEIAETMNDDEKLIVREIKKALNWK